jgi:hypothetical protein
MICLTLRTSQLGKDKVDKSRVSVMGAKDFKRSSYVPRYLGFRVQGTQILGTFRCICIVLLTQRRDKGLVRAAEARLCNKFRHP